MTLYEASVALHVVAVVLAFGPTFAYPFIQLGAERRGGAALPAAFATILLISRSLAVPAALVVGATGAFQALTGPHDPGEPWIVAGAALFVAILALALGVLVPRLRRAQRLTEAGQLDDYRRGRPVLVVVGALVAMLVLTTVVVMELKPG